MIRSLRNIPRNPNPIQSLPIPYSKTLISSHHHHHNKKNSRSPPSPPDLTLISSSISSLPPRFTPSDLSTAINHLPDPRLCLPLLQSALHHHNLLRHNNSFSPFLTTINRLGKSRLFRDMDSAASLAFSFPSLPLPSPFFHSLIHFYSQSHWISKAIAVYKIMRNSKSAPRPTTKTFNLLFSAILGHRGANSYVHHMYMDALRSLFRQMWGMGVAPDVKALNFMIKGYVLSLHVNDALRVFHQMVAVYGVEPDEHTYSYLVHGLCGQGRTRNAKEMFGEMRGKGLVPTGRACNSIVSVLAMAGEVEEAVVVMWEVVGIGRRLDFVTCRTVVEEIWKERGVGDAEVVVREMRRKEVIDGECYKELVRRLGEEYCD